MSGLSLIEHNVHDIHVGERHILFHIPTTSLFELDDVGGEVLQLFRSKPSIESDDVRRHFDGRFPPDQVVETIQEFVNLDIIDDGGPVRRERAPISVKSFPLSTLVLNVNTGCNLSCSYCYKEDLVPASEGERMEFETARDSVELLLHEGRERDRVNIVFFGGEPLTNMPLIKRVVNYAEGRCTELDKKVDFTVTTNATLLTERIVDYFDAHRFGLTISMDGPQAIHDLRRKTVGGKGTYKVVAEKARMLLARYRSRPVGARVTLTKGVTEVEEIHHHLIREIGFHEVGFSPVTAGDIAEYNLDGAELAAVFRNMMALGQVYRDAAMRGENIGFSNMHQLMTDLHDGMTKALPCGAGVGLLAVDKDGGLNLCHRFTGSDLPTFGDVKSGIDKERLSGFLEERADREGTVCEKCRIRNLCSGGCYHESYARYGDPQHPTIHYCDLMRDWIDFGISVYAEILEHNPGFFEKIIEPRRAYK